MLPDKALTLSEKQRGVIARFQLCRLMEDDDLADNCIRHLGPVDPPVRGVHRVRGGAPQAEQFAFAAALRSRPKATVTGPIVLGLLGVDGFGTDAPFEILTQPGRRLTNVPFRHRRDPHPDRPVATHGEVRTAGPVDALIDSAAFVDEVGERPLRVAYDQLRWRGIIEEHRVRDRLEQFWSDAPGAPILSRLLEFGGGFEPESEGERGLGSILGCFEPAAEPQVWVTPSRRTDWFFRSVRCGFEYLGKVDHDHVAGRIADDQRDAELREEGIRLHYVTSQDLAQPRALLASVAGMLTVRAHDLGVPAPVAVRPLPGLSAA